VNDAGRRRKGATRRGDGTSRRALAGVLAAVALLLLQGCGSLPLGPWHTERLDEEFRVAKARDVDTFAGYLQLEQRLFAQLDDEVYARVEPAPDTALLRYSPGSVSDPRGRQPDWNRTFELRAEQPIGGVLLLHGMSDSPYSLRALGEELNRRGYWVIGLRLPGHGTAPSGLLSVRWEDMAAAVRLATAHLAAAVGTAPIHLIGYSTGAPLAVEFTLAALEGRERPVPASLVLVSPAIGIHAAAAAAGWKRRVGTVPGLRGLAWLSVEAEFDPYKYNSFATNAGEQVHRLTQSVSRSVARYASSPRTGEFPPILVFQSSADSTVLADASGARLLGPLGALDPQRHKLVVFDVNREAAKSVLLVSDRRAIATRLPGDARLPYAVTLVTNENEDSATVVARHQPPLSAEVARTEPLGLAWPVGVISLSHVALPIPPDDPLYGRRPPDNRDVLFLGQMAIQGERGTLVLPAEWLLRLRFNPFYSYLSSRALDWIDGATAAHR
jgi:alpha-beta hydrolase superfamily lysophospholipase